MVLRLGLWASPNPRSCETFTATKAKPRFATNQSATFADTRRQTAPYRGRLPVE